MAGERAGFWDVEHRLRELSAQGDLLETLAATVDFEIFRVELVAAFGSRDPAKGNRPGFDAVLKFRMLVLQAMHELSLEQTKYFVRDRLSWMRFCGLGPGDAVPDANTLWDFHEALIRAEALDALLARIGRAICEAGYIRMSGQIVDATLVVAPRQRNTDGENAAIKASRTAAEIWPEKPAKARQKDVDACWTLKVSKAFAKRRHSLKPAEDGALRVDIGIPVFDSKSHIAIDRRHGIIRHGTVTDAAAHDDARLCEGLIDPNNTASDVWADTAYHSAEHEAFLASIGKVSRIHRRKPKGRPMTRRTAQANAKKSVIWAHVEHPFAQWPPSPSPTSPTTSSNGAGSTGELCTHDAVTQEQPRIRTQQDAAMRPIISLKVGQPAHHAPSGQKTGFREVSAWLSGPRGTTGREASGLTVVKEIVVKDEVLIKGEINHP